MKLKFFNLKFFQKKQTHAPAVGEVSQKTLHKNLDFTATEQYKLLRANLDFTIPAGEKCPVIGAVQILPYTVDQQQCGIHGVIHRSLTSLRKQIRHKTVLLIGKKGL